jgi:parallel beta-helix repeat protein
MKIIFLFFCTFLILSFNSLFAQNVVFSSKNAKYQEYSGNINEDLIWSDTVHVTGDITMNGTLTIKPGTYIEFQGLYQLNINKRLIAEGTLQDSIRFTPKNKLTGWKGIEFYDYYGLSQKDSSVLSYCVIEYGKGSTEFNGTSGGGLYVYNWQNIVIRNSSIRNNSATVSGGGIYCYESNILIDNCSINSNRATEMYSSGGGIYFENSPAIIKNSNISNNYSGSDGGGIYNNSSNFTCENNTIENNQVTGSGAGIYSYNDSTVYIGNKFVRNSIIGYFASNGYGGGLFCSGYSRIENNLFENNIGGQGGAISLNARGKIYLINNRIQKNKATVGGAVFSEYSDAEITDNFIFNNTANVAGGIYITSCSPLLVNNLICNNTAVYDGGAVYIYWEANPVFINNTLAYNTAASGYAVFGSTGVNAQFYNTIIFGPQADLGGGQICQDAESANLTFNHCDIQAGLNGGVGSSSSSHVLDYDPGFVKPSAGAGANYDASLADWSLKGNSLCINAGTTDTSGLKIPQYDIKGNKRIRDTIDIGAYEYNGTIVNTPEILIRTITFYFNTITVGDNDVSAFVIRNDGRGELRISSLSAPDGFEVKLLADSVFNKSINGLTIKPGRDTTIYVAFHPSAPGNYSDVISIKCNDTDTDSLGVKVSGTATNDLVVRGNITKSALWSGNVYVYETSTIMKGAKITIAPGTNVIFRAYCALNIQGSLVAVGTKTDSIKFVNEKAGSSGWSGIVIDNLDGSMSSTDSTKFIYCRIEGTESGALNIKRFSSVIISKCNFSNNTNGAIYCDYSSNPLISDNLFYKNASYTGGGVRCSFSSNPTIINNTFDKNHVSNAGGAIYCFYSSSPLISGNSFTYNSAAYGAVIGVQDTSNPKLIGNFMSNNNGSEGGVVYCFNFSKPTMTNNIMVNNIGYEGGVIYIAEGFVTLINNTICNNRGQYCSAIKSLGGNSDFLAVNTIFYGNTSPDGIQMLLGQSSSPYIINCDIQGGLGTIKSDYGYNSSSFYLNNIDANPLFAYSSGTGSSSISDKYLLSAKSPCINAGISDTSKYYFPRTDFAGKPRIFNNIIDIGALEYQLPVSVEKEIILPVNNALMQNYPNPFNPSTMIRYSLVKESYVRLSVYNSIGAHITDLVNKVLPAGIYEELFNAENLSSGIYFYTITIQSSDGKDNFRSVKKMQLIK